MHQDDLAAVQHQNLSFVRHDQVRGVCKEVYDLDDHDSEAVKSQLLLLSSQIQHQCMDLPGNNLTCCGSAAAGVREHMPRGPIVRYDPEIVAAIYNNELSYDEERTSIVRVAAVMLHEFAHALAAWWWTRKTHPNEPFYEESKLAEAGYELTARLFDGVPHLTRTRHNQLALRIDEYPSQRILSGEPLTASCKTPLDLPRWLQAREWIISLEFIWNLVDDEHWADPIRARDSAALIPKSLAHNIRQWLDVGVQPPVFQKASSRCLDRKDEGAALASRCCGWGGCSNRR